MKIFYLIQAHKNPSQLRRLIGVLSEQNTYFVIHIDLKSNIKEFKDVIKSNRVFFTENRVDCIWGDYSQVLATLVMMREIDKLDPKPNDRVVLLSGQDYPIKSNQFITQFFNEFKDTCFIDIEYEANQYRDLYHKIKTYKINKSSQREDFIMVSRYYLKNLLKNIVKGKVNIADLKFLFYDKKIPLGLDIYKGGTWWSMNYMTQSEILRFYDIHKKELDNFFGMIFTADEMFFHTLIMLLKQSSNAFKIDSSNTYVNWNRKGVSLPVTFTKNDEIELFSQNNNKLFARKFDTALDSEILDMIDLRLKER